MRSVERGPDQIVHRRIHHQKLFAAVFLCVERARQQRAGGGHDRASRLQQQMQAGVPQRLHQRRGVGVYAALEITNARIPALCALVANTQAAAGIHKVDVQPVGLQLPHQRKHALHRLAKRLHVGNLRADMHAHAHRIEEAEACGLAIQLASLCDAHAELMLA